MNKSPEIEIILKLKSLEQAHAVLEALELFARVGMGQLDELTSMARDGRIPYGPSGVQGDEIQSLNRVADLIGQVKTALGHSPSSSWGIVAPEVPIQARRAWEAYRILAQAVGSHQAATKVAVGRRIFSDGLSVRVTNDDAVPGAEISLSQRAPA